MELINGERLSGGPFTVKLTEEEMALIAYALMGQANSNELPADAWVREPSRPLSYQFADVVGIH